MSAPLTGALRVSASLYVTWKRCPAQAAARLAGHYQPDTIHTFRGLLAHRIFARHYREGKINPVDFTTACKQEIGSSNLNYKMRDIGLSNRDVNGVILVVGDIYRRFLTVARSYPVTDTEIHVETQVGDDVTLVGRIDAAINPAPLNSTRLIDWKTGEVGDHVIDQLRFYALVWWLSGRGLPMQVEAVSVTTGERVAEWITKKLLDETMFEVAEMIGDLSSPGSVETPGPWCRWCPILDDCAPGRKTVELVGA